MPHKVLTKPAQAFEYFFEGMRKGQQRDHLIKLEATAKGTLNALEKIVGVAATIRFCLVRGKVRSRVLFVTNLP